MIDLAEEAYSQLGENAWLATLAFVWESKEVSHDGTRMAARSRLAADAGSFGWPDRQT
jgi:hypothetical protein